jgi:hypothetical protein
MADAGTTAMHLPPELWCKILNGFEFKPEADTLPSISLTCRYLHSIAQAFIFRRFHLQHRGYHDANDLPRKIARLDFYASDAIAPHVLDLSLFIGYRVKPPVSTEITTLLFNALPRFLKTRSLECYGINFTQLGLQQISSLPYLERFRVMACTLPLQIEMLPMIRPRTFHYTGRSTNCLGVHHWLALLDPDYLQALDIPITSDTCAFFLASDNPSLLPFPSLHTINCYSHHGTLPQLPQLFSRTPALRCLKLSLRPVNPATVAQYMRIVESFGSPLPCSVPYLEQYNGPHELLPVVFGRAVVFPSGHLRRLVLESVADKGDSLGAFVNSLKSCHPLQLKDVTHLHIFLLKSMDLKFLTTLRDMFPALQELHIRPLNHYSPGGLSYYWLSQADSLFNTIFSLSWVAFMYNVQLTDLYTLPLPRSMVSLSIQWISDGDTTDLPSLVAAKDSLLLRLPSLRRLWLCDLSKQALLWSRTASGKEECCTLHEGVSYPSRFSCSAHLWRLVGSRDKISSAWQMRVAVFPEDPIFVYF